MSEHTHQTNVNPDLDTDPPTCVVCGEVAPRRDAATVIGGDDAVNIDASDTEPFVEGHEYIVTYSIVTATPGNFSVTIRGIAHCVLLTSRWWISGTGIDDGCYVLLDDDTPILEIRHLFRCCQIGERLVPKPTATIDDTGGI